MAVAHLDLHGSVSAYHAVKARILDALGRDGCLVGNADDDRVARLLERWPATEGDGMTITAGLRQPADVSATPVDRSLFGQTFLVTAGGHSMPVAVPVPVAGFVRDSLLAIAVGLRYRLPLERIGRGIEAAGSVSGRLERIDRGQEYAAFIDHPTSGHAVAATLAGLRRLTSGRLVVLAEAACAARLMKEGSGSSGSSRSPSADDGDGIDERFARRVSRWADECFVVPRTLLAEEGMAADIVAYARIDRLLHALEAGDCLVVLGHPGGGLGPVEPDGDPLSLAAVVEGWLQLAHVPEPGFRGRRAA